VNEKKRTSYTVKVTELQVAALRRELEAAGWEFSEKAYAHWCARKDKTTVIPYHSGKLVVQGRGTADFVQFLLEPKVLGEARFGYEDILAAKEDPAQFEEHAGIDESGKGDFFGPLVIAAAVVTPETAQALVQAGVMDSKRIRDDRKIAALAQTIRQRLGDSTAVVPIGPEAYNRLYGDFQNVNRLLAWGHARALEDVLEKHPGCPRALSDQFGNKTTVERALMTRGRGIKLEQRTKAESDVAVAAASILARHEFVRRLERLGKDVGATLPKGANPHVKQVAVDLVHRYGPDVLRKVAKTHFKTHAQVLDAARK